MQTDLKGKVALVTGADVALTDILMEGQNHDREELGRYSVLASHFTQTGEVRKQAGVREIQAMGSRALAPTYYT